MKPLCLTLALLLTTSALAQKKQVAITIDDLPVASVGDDASPAANARTEQITRDILAALKRHHAPAIGFVNEVKLNVNGARDERAALLDQWLAAGNQLGNHGYSHHSISKLSLDEQKFEVVRGELITNKLLARRNLPKEHFFRFPFSDLGNTKEIHDAFAAFLTSRGYESAPITLGADDWLYADLYDRAKKSNDTAMVGKLTTAYLEETKYAIHFADAESTRMFQRDIPQSILIHASSMNADLLDRVLKLFEDDNYTFITLDAAVADKAYATPDEFYSSQGENWFARWRIHLKTPPLDQPKPAAPQWAWDAYNKANSTK